MKIAIYDGRCGVCRSFAKALRNYVSPYELDVVPCGSEIQKKIAKHVSEELCLKSFVLVESDGTIFSGSEAVLKAISLAPALKKFSFFAESLAVKKAAEVIYKGVSSIRHRDPK